MGGGGAESPPTTYTNHPGYALGLVSTFEATILHVCVCVLWLLQIEQRAVRPSLIWKQLSPGFLIVVAQDLIFSS